MRQLTQHASKSPKLFRRRSSPAPRDAVLDLALVMPVLLGLHVRRDGVRLRLISKAYASGRGPRRRPSGGGAGATAQNVQDAVDGAITPPASLRRNYTALRRSRRPTAAPRSRRGPAHRWARSHGERNRQLGHRGVSVLPTGLGGIPTTKNITGATTMRKEWIKQSRVRAGRPIVSPRS